ncbi:hypothetical protein [Streptomyces sp. NPDC016845]|uniref:hypothetical protein n=1 Tax=Streptomyces sp. NPDC016845 TaxID=3364972 RepID=UPI0037A2AE45
MSRLLPTLRRPAVVASMAFFGLCLLAWWAVQPVGPDCPTLSSDPYGSTFDSSQMATHYHSTLSSGEDCMSGSTHPRLYDWFGR